MQGHKKGGAYISVSEQYDLVGYNDIEKGLAHADINEKEKNLRLLITNILNNESYPEMILNVINNIMPYQGKNSMIKKMLFLYWEIIEVNKPDATLKDELILVCNNFRNDLISANEYVAGRALKLLSKMMIKQIIQPLVDTILDKNLYHTDSYVRRYAILCLQKIWEAWGEELLVDFEEKIEVFLMKETDLTCRRNAYQLIFEVNREKALGMTLSSIQDGDIENFGDILQLIIVQMLRKTAKADAKLAGRAIKYIKHFADSKFNSVLYETAISLISLTNNVDTLRIAMGLLLQLLKGNSDNNVKLLILDQLDHIRKLNPRILEESFTELVVLLKSDSVDLKIQFLKFLEFFLNSKNIVQILGTLQKELTESFNDKSNQSQKYQSYLLSIIHKYLVVKVIPPMEIVNNTLPGLLAHEIKNKSSFDIIRSIISHLTFKEGPEVHRSVNLLFLESLLMIEDKDLMMGAIYHLGRSLTDEKDTQDFIFKLKCSAGPFPFILKDKKSEGKKTDEEATEAPKKKLVTKTVIRSDGTYGDEQIEVSEGDKEYGAGNNGLGGGEGDSVVLHKIRTWLMKSEVFALSVARSLARVLRVLDYTEMNSKKALGDVVVLFCQLVQFYQKAGRSVDDAFFKGMSDLVRQLTNKENFKPDGTALVLSIDILEEVEDPRDTSGHVENSEEILNKNLEETAEAQVDELIFFRQLQPRNEMDLEVEVFNGGGINFDEQEEKNDYTQRLAKLVQQTGTSDPIYIEAFVYQNRFDTYLEIVMINRSPEIYKNITLSFFSVGDSEKTAADNKTLDQIDNVLLKENSSITLYKTLKITPKDAMYVAANLTFENTRGEMVRNSMTSEITQEILDQIYPANITNYEFRNLWQKYNWENRIEVNTPFEDPIEFVDHLCKELKIKIVENLTPFADNKYLSANLYAKTLMGCDFLLNLSVEKEGNCLKGHVRIRSEQKMVVVNIYKHLRQIQATKPKAQAADV